MVAASYCGTGTGGTTSCFYQNLSIPNGQLISIGYIKKIIKTRHMQVHQSKHMDRLTKNDRVHMIITFTEHAQTLKDFTKSDYQKMPKKRQL